MLDVHGGYHVTDAPHSLTLGSDEPVRLPGGGGLRLSISHHYRVVKAEGRRGPWKVSSAAYLYALDDGDGHELLAYHWHPEWRSAIARPHLHLGAGAMVGHKGVAEAHLETGRVAIESLLRCAIAELGAEPLRDDWRQVLDDAQAAFEKWRTWPSARS